MSNANRLKTLKGAVIAFLLMGLLSSNAYAALNVSQLPSALAKNKQNQAQTEQTQNIRRSNRQNTTIFDDESQNNRLPKGQELSSADIAAGRMALRQGVLLPGEVPISELLPKVSGEAPPPYAANLFAGGYETERLDGLNENYLIAVGDKVSVWIWGAVSFNSVLTVDNQGNIFIPNIGPVRLKGVPAGTVNKVVTSKIKSIYKNNISVYVNLLSATPVSVYIAGSVVRPGQYAGLPTDTVLYYLKRAGGVDTDRGSYRDIRVMRNGEVVSKIDLYDFVENGTIDNLTFKDKDTILVGEQGPVVDVYGHVKKPFRFEFESESIKGSELLNLAKPMADTTHVLIQGTRQSGPFSTYLTVNELKGFEVRSGDKLLFKEDQRPQVYDIEVAGSYLGPSFYTVTASTRLHDILSHIPVDPKLADHKSVYLLRKSVAEEQRRILEQSLERLERTVFFSPSSSTGEASIKAQEAKLISDFIERARKIQPIGKVIVSDGEKVANVTLEQGDVIMIPHKTDLIQIGGEVMVPQALVFNEEASLQDYVAWSGGFSNRADKDVAVIVRANGLTQIVDSDSDAPLQAGDKVIIMPKVETKVMQAVKDITQILFQLAVTANAID